jgi:hypothetical protein
MGAGPTCTIATWTIDRELSAAREGRFRIEPLMFHLAGIPSYLVLAELAVKRILRGQLPLPECRERGRRRRLTREPG